VSFKNTYEKIKSEQEEAIGKIEKLRDINFLINLK
jgi:hypothetical protein